MNKRLNIGLFLIFCLAFKAYAQDYDLAVSGNFQDTPFPEFVSAVEQQTDARFYYFDIWVAGVKISTSGTDLSLNKILSRALLPIGVHHYIDEFGDIYLSYENRLIQIGRASCRERV